MNFKCYHYDIARGAYLKADVFKDALRLAADSGFTHFLPYLENMIKLEPMIKACPASAYSPEQWREFDAVAEEVGIELIPHFNVIGHSREVCYLYPELAGDKGGFELDVTLDTVKDWTRKCIEEYCSFSKGKHFLIGGDEWQTPNHNLADPEFNIAKVWAEHINLAIEVLNENDRIPIIWHDMLLHYPEALEFLSKDAIIAFWFYDEDSDHPVLEMFQKHGFKTIMASGMCNGMLSNRRRRAIECALKASEKYNSYGVMVTSWSDGRWEKQSLSIQLVGKILRKDVVPEDIIRAISLLELIERNESMAPEYTSILRQEILPLMTSNAWDNFPLYKEYVSNFLQRDKAQELKLYEERHFAEGPLYYCIKNDVRHGDNAGGLLRKDTKFKVSSSEKSLGERIKIINGDESFLIYPKSGGTLQAYTKGDTEIIPHSLPRFIQNTDFLPGGYRSYSGVGGFRPIWAFGSHHNPCTIWQGAFEWEIKEEDDRIEIFLSRKMQHVDVQYKIIVNKGQSGFVFEAKAINKIENAYGTFSFNLPISINPKEFNNTIFEWDKEHLQLGDVRDNFFVLPASDTLKMTVKDIVLLIESDKRKSAGFYIDWSASSITPDLRGIYRKLQSGNEYSTSWKFSIL